jgi:CRP/FNR family transcriptional regulator, cyclic AMP receptor protein
LSHCEFQENLATLREIDFFSELPLDLLKVIAYLCSREKYQEGDFLINRAKMTVRHFILFREEPDLCMIGRTISSSYDSMNMVRANL